MRNNVATTCARVGIATLAALGVFAVPGGAASASASSTGALHPSVAAGPSPAQCAAIQQQIDTLDSRVMALQDLLAEATPAQKPDIIRQILRLEAQMDVLQARLANCTF